MPVIHSPRDCREFQFVAHRYNPATGAAEFVYRADDGPELVERIRFPHAPWPPEPSRQAAFSAALQLLHLVAGVSYWKAGLAPVMRLETPLAADLAEFMSDLYRQGLAEFAHVNRLTLAGRIRFPIGPAISGNPRPLLDCDDRGVDYWVIELSSYQIADLEARPDVAVLLNLAQEHLDWHSGYANYRRDKLRLLQLAADRTWVLEESFRDALPDGPSARAIFRFNSEDGIHFRDGQCFDGAAPIAVTVPAGLPGRHNRSNIAAALTAARVIGADLDDTAASVSSFCSLPHRLQVLGEAGGVRYIDDSIASTPLSTAAALESLAGQPVILLLGGMDRGVDWSPHLRSIIAHAPQAIIGLPDNGERIAALLRSAGCEPARGFRAARDLAEAVSLAQQLARPGDIVLLSPGAPSFNQFVDFSARGKAFARLAGFET